MSLRLIVIVSTYVMVLAAAADVAAMDFRRALLNNFGDGKAQTCNDVDWQMIDNILITSAKIVELPTPISNGYNRRYLRSGEERMLQTASQCRSACEGYATGRCFARGCGWWNKANSAVAPPLDALDSVTKTEPEPDGIRELRAAEEQERSLLTASQCKYLCAGYATGRCYVQGCIWWNTANSAVAPPLDALDSVTKTEPEPDGIRELRAAEEQERSLLTASQCKYLCAGYATGRCYVQGCIWWNTANSAVAPPLDALDSVTKTEPAPDGTRTRTLKKDNAMITTPCSEQQIKYINHELNNLIRTKAVTASCQSLLKDSRHITCYRRTDDINELDAVM